MQIRIEVKHKTVTEKLEGGTVGRNWQRLKQIAFR